MRKLISLGILSTPLCITLLMLAVAAPITYGTSSNTWEGTGGGSVTVISVAPKITEVTFDKRFIEPGVWVTVTVKVTNDGPGTAPLQGIHVGLPFDPPTADIQIVSTDLSEGAKIYPKGSTLGGPYGSVTSKYPIVEGWQKDFAKGATRTLTIKVKFPDTATVAFDVKSVACTADWKVIGSDPKSGMIDQQGEYVRPYLILTKFTIVMASTDTKDVSIPIINHNRYPPSGAPSQPSLVVNSFTVTDKGVFGGSITALNLPLTIAPGSIGTLKIRVATSNHASGAYTILYKVSGSP